MSSARLIHMIVCILFFTHYCPAQPFELDIVSITPGSSTFVTTSDFSLSLSIGQPLTTNDTSLATYEIDFGFFPALSTIPSCQADFTGDGVLDFFDASAFLDAYAADEPAADYNGSGSIDFFDVSDFLTDFSAGCP